MTKGRRRKVYDLATDTSLGRVRRHVSVWLGIVALAFNIFAGAVLPAQPAQAETNSAAGDAAGQPLMVCTPDGMVEIGQDGKPVPSQQTSGHDQLCIFCLPLLHGGTNVPAIEPLLEPALAVLGSVEILPTENPIAPPRLEGISLPRAPPSV